MKKSKIITINPLLYMLITVHLGVLAFQIKEISAEPLLISLGYNCYPAYQIQQHGWRVTSFPFDWNLSSLKGINQLLHDDFRFFLNMQYLKPGIDFFSNLICNSVYDIYFSHDFPYPNHDWQNYLANVQKKYERRIERFNKLSAYKDKIFFIRLIFDVNELNIPNEFRIDEVITLKHELFKKFPLVDFELILIFWNSSNQFDDIKNYDWSTLGIKNFYILGKNPQWSAEWNTQHITEQFRSIFESLGISKRQPIDANFDFQKAFSE